jgi:tetratricopeptide (TPR) repeat protein
MARGLAWYFMLQAETNGELKRTYAQNAIDDFRMAESLGFQLNNDALNVIGELEALLAQATLIPRPVNPQLARNYLLIGNRQYEQEQYENAISSFTEAITINSEYSRAYHNRGLAYYQLAKMAIDMALKIDYAQNAIDDFRMAQSLGYELDEENQQILEELETMLAETTPTP